MLVVALNARGRIGDDSARNEEHLAACNSRTLIGLNIVTWLHRSIFFYSRFNVSVFVIPRSHHSKGS